MSLLCLSTILWLALAGCGPAPVGQPDNTSIQITVQPEQYDLEDAEPVALRSDDYHLSLELKAEYVLQGVVLGIKRYRYDRGAFLAPYDIAVAWHQLTATGLYKQLKWGQSGRWYFWRYGEDFPFDNAFVAKNSANSHLIPASENIKRALGRVREGDHIAIEGYLVQVSGLYKGEEFTWNSSLSRNDEGDGSCEVIYVTRIRFGGLKYE
jgi:hypothetical protein